ncbi:MAG: outer membrane protein assembly factor BamE [Mariprofundaceae bacterium]
MKTSFMESINMKLLLRVIAITLLLSTSACRTYEIHQGNVMKNEDIWSIQEGDTRFRVETLLGTPAMIDPLHPNRVRYVEDHRNSETEKDKLRVVEITYDDALRVKKIEYSGFDK